MRVFCMRKILMIAFLGTLAIAAFAGVVMLLWNWLVPDLFGGPLITFIQAAGLLLLIKILTWSFGGKRHHRMGNYWKSKFRAKFANMSEEEREEYKLKFKDTYEKRWCRWHDEDKETLDQ